MSNDNEKKQKTVFRDNQDIVPKDSLPGNRKDRSDKMGSLNSEEIRFKNADDIYEEYWGKGIIEVQDFAVPGIKNVAIIEK